MGAKNDGRECMSRGEKSENRQGVKSDNRSGFIASGL
jgi:hypothetical protein